MHIRKATLDDFNEIMSIYRSAQEFMIESGNPTQWGHSYPEKKLIADDIDSEVCHLICDESGVCGVFALFDNPEPTYQNIEGGEWLNDDVYVTIHRIASNGRTPGVFKCAVTYCKSISDNIRIDTHKNNSIMQNQIEKNGFKRCGIIHVRDGSERIAYQWSRQNNPSP